MTDPSTLFLNAARHFLGDEYRVKLKTAVRAVPPDRLWWRPNESSNSIGNLLVHLAGNLRQWMLSGVGGRPYARNRAAEFAARDGADGAALLADLERVLDDVDDLLARLPPERLLERCAIQGRDVTVLEAIFHVTEHFSMHLGQIILMAKMFAPGEVRFYEDAGGLAKPLWTPHRTPPSSGTSV